MVPELFCIIDPSGILVPWVFLLIRYKFSDPHISHWSMLPIIGYNCLFSIDKMLCIYYAYKFIYIYSIRKQNDEMGKSFMTQCRRSTLHNAKYMLFSEPPPSDPHAAPASCPVFHFPFLISHFPLLRPQSEFKRNIFIMAACVIIVFKINMYI